MKKKFIERSISLIKNTKEINALEEKKLRYGLEGFFNLITKTVVFFVLAIVLDIVLEYLLLIVVYSTLRLYGFGIHMKTSLQCWCTSLPMYIGGCMMIKYVIFPQSVFYIIWLFGLISFLLFAPADTPARPLIHREKRIRAKVLSICILIAYFFIFIQLDNFIFQNLIVYAIFMESIAINPIIYKLFHTSFNNFRNFEHNMV